MMQKNMILFQPKGTGDFRGCFFSHFLDMALKKEVKTMETKGILIVYPDVRWVTPKSFKELEEHGFVYKFHDFVDDGNIDFVHALINWVRADSKTFYFWAAKFIPNAG